MKINLTLLLILVGIASCKKIIERTSKLTLITENKTNHSVSVAFFPGQYRTRSLEDFTLIPGTQNSQTEEYDAAVVPIGNSFPFMAYGNADSIRIVFDKSRFLSFKRPAKLEDCNIPFNIYCVKNQTCVNPSSSQGTCTFTLTEEMYRQARTL